MGWAFQTASFEGRVSTKSPVSRSLHGSGPNVTGAYQVGTESRPVDQKGRTKGVPDEQPTERATGAPRVDKWACTKKVPEAEPTEGTVLVPVDEFGEAAQGHTFLETQWQASQGCELDPSSLEPDEWLLKWNPELKMLERSGQQPEVGELGGSVQGSPMKRVETFIGTKSGQPLRTYGITRLNMGSFVVLAVTWAAPDKKWAPRITWLDTETGCLGCITEQPVQAPNRVTLSLPHPRALHPMSTAMRIIFIHIEDKGFGFHPVTSYLGKGAAVNNLVDGLLCILITDRDGVPVLKDLELYYQGSFSVSATTDKAPELAMRPNFLSTFAMATDQGGKLGLGKNKLVICSYSTYQVVQLNKLPLVVSFLGSITCNTGHILSLESHIEPLLGDLKTVVAES
uniref:Uncharacterized protein n=3 Tax=Timema TaxID=61471 RepID=A0A7R9CSA7_TIMCR|nr:unnamed protein product [Timema cristinae]